MAAWIHLETQRTYGSVVRAGTMDRKHLDKAVVRKLCTASAPLGVRIVTTGAMSKTETDLTTPEFRGCVFCYSAEWGLYGARKAAKRLGEDEDG